MKKIISLALLLVVFTLTGCHIDDHQNEFVRTPMFAEELQNTPVLTLEGGYNLVWADEFDYEGSPDPTKWGYDFGTGNGGW